MNFSVLTIASSKGSRHPFIFPEELLEFQNRMLKKRYSLQEVNACLLIIKRWVLIDDRRLGASVRLATKTEGTSGNQYLVSAVTFRDLFDRKSDVKMLRVFDSGSTLHHIKEICRTWVMVKKPLDRSIPRDSFLYHPDKIDSDYRQNELEARNHINLYCFSATVDQRVADWFLMKQFRVTATMAGVVK